MKLERDTKDTLSIRIDKALKEQIRKRAEKENRSVSSTTSMLIKYGFKLWSDDAQRTA